MGKQRAGRPPKDGERYPSGQLKPEIAPAVLARMRTAVQHGLLDPKFGSQIGRLLMMGRLSAIEATAAFRIGEIYGRFETQNGLCRSTRAPSYESGISTGGRADSAGDDELDARRRAVEEEWLALQDLLDDYPRQVRNQLEGLCVEDIAISSMILPAIATILGNVASALNSSKARAKKRKKKTPALMLVTKEHRAAPQAPPARRADHKKAAWMLVQKKLRPDLDAAQLNEAYGIFTAFEDREAFRDDKARKADLNHDRL